MKEKVLLINDLPGYGKVALSAMMPVLSHMGYDLYNLPTALVSNTLDYGLFDILETTQYMKNTIGIWEKLGFTFDALSTGFIVSAEQVALVTDYCQEQSLKVSKIFVDPIMGDDGVLYNGITEKTVTYMKKLCQIADYVVPNYTEAAFLAGLEIKQEDGQGIGLKEAEGYALVDKLRGMGAKSVIITSVHLENTMAVMGFDAIKDKYFSLPFTLVPVRFPGTGDIFSAVMMGQVLKGIDLKASVQAAMDYVKKLIILNQDNVDKFKGIPIEASLGEIDKLIR